MLRSAEEIRAQMRALRKELNKVDPQSRSKRGSQAYDDFYKFKQLGKDVVSVGWGNSRKSAEAQFAKTKAKKARGEITSDPYEGWDIQDNEDIDGDGSKDVIIIDSNGNKRIINGQTIKRSRHPKREMYYDQYPTRDLRKGHNERVKEGQEKHFNKKYNQINIVRNPDGSTKISKIDGKTPSPYRLFAQKFYGPIWDMLKAGFSGSNTEKMEIYRTLLSAMWSRVKDVAYSTLGIQKPSNKEDMSYVEARKPFKNKLRQLMDELTEDPQKFFNDAISIIISKMPDAESYVRSNLDAIYNNILVNMYDIAPERMIFQKANQPREYTFGRKAPVMKLEEDEDIPTSELPWDYDDN